MPASARKSQESSSGLGNLYVDDWKKTKEELKRVLCIKYPINFKD